MDPPAVQTILKYNGHPTFLWLGLVQLKLGNHGPYCKGHRTEAFRRMTNSSEEDHLATEKSWMRMKCPSQKGPEIHSSAGKRLTDLRPKELDALTWTVKLRKMM